MLKSPQITTSPCRACAAPADASGNSTRKRSLLACCSAGSAGGQIQRDDGDVAEVGFEITALTVDFADAEFADDVQRLFADHSAVPA